MKISDKRSKTRGYAIDMNPFHENKKTLTIEMPDKMIKRLNISSEQEVLESVMLI